MRLFPHFPPYFRGLKIKKFTFWFSVLENTEGHAEKVAFWRAKGSLSRPNRNSIPWKSLMLSRPAQENFRKIFKNFNLWKFFALEERAKRISRKAFLALPGKSPIFREPGNFRKFPAPKTTRSPAEGRLLLQRALKSTRGPTLAPSPRAALGARRGPRFRLKRNRAGAKAVSLFPASPLRVVFGPRRGSNMPKNEPKNVPKMGQKPVKFEPNCPEFCPNLTSNPTQNYT